MAVSTDKQLYWFLLLRWKHFYPLQRTLWMTVSSSAAAFPSSGLQQWLSTAINILCDCISCKRLLIPMAQSSNCYLIKMKKTHSTSLVSLLLLQLLHLYVMFEIRYLKYKNPLWYDDLEVPSQKPETGCRSCFHVSRHQNKGSIILLWTYSNNAVQKEKSLHHLVFSAR